MSSGTWHNFKSPRAVRVLVSSRTSVPSPLLSMKTISPRCSRISDAIAQEVADMFAQNFGFTGHDAPAATDDGDRANPASIQ